MTQIPDATLLNVLVIGLPLMLLAFAVMYHAYLYASRTPARQDAAPAGPEMPAPQPQTTEAAEAAEELRRRALARIGLDQAAALDAAEGEATARAMRQQLQHQQRPTPSIANESFEYEIDEVDEQLARQREALQSLLSEARQSLESMAPAEGASPFITPTTPQARTPAARTREPLPAPGRAPGGPEGDVRGTIRRLAAEGLSERSIARRLRVGLEEVRMVTRRGSVDGRQARRGPPQRGGGRFSPRS